MKFVAGWWADATSLHAKLPSLNRNYGRDNMFIIWWIVVGLIAGFLTGKLMKGSGFGALMDIVVGIVGAVVGGFIMRSLGFASQGGLIYTILVAIVGAVILTLIVRLVSGGSRRIA